LAAKILAPGGEGETGGSAGVGKIVKGGYKKKNNNIKSGGMKKYKEMGPTNYAGETRKSPPEPLRKNEWLEWGNYNRKTRRGGEKGRRVIFWESYLVSFVQG